MSTDVRPPAAYTGLSQEEARARLRRDGPNELPAQEKRGLLAIAVDVVREPMFLLLVAAGTLYLLTGEPADALMLLGFVFVVLTITIVQERRTERALDALRDLSSPRALVIRDGEARRIAGREVVRGDVLVLAEGDRVPADAILRQGTNLTVDESLLTGEAVPVRKVASVDAAELDHPGGDNTFSAFSGTLVTAGQGVAEVIRTGFDTELGRIGKVLAQVEPEDTLLQKETGRLVRVCAIAGLSACALVVVMYSLTRGGSADTWKEGLLAGIAMAMATLPEEFPVVLTVFLALGAWRISRNHVLTRRMPAIETLGAATVLCVDKTGTLTLNQMSVKRLSISGRVVDPSEARGALAQEFLALLDCAVMASKPDPFDPMERAIHAAGGKAAPGWIMVREYPLTPGLLAVSQMWKQPGSNELVAAAKGAPEAIAKLCRMPEDRKEALSAEVAVMASKGLRVLGVARGQMREEELPEEHHGLELEFVGLIGLEDPLRPTVPSAVAECRSAGIRVVMITGDYPLTARSIARQAGLGGCETVITGPELEQMPGEELTRRIENVNIFARVVPEQKLLIVNALKANGEIVAMTGDGVNDAPALKTAHIGIAMGGRGTDVAREAASLVLLDDDFSSIVAAVRLGRRIFDNIKKAVSFILAVHVPIAGLSMLPVFFPAWPLLLLPVHIVFLELIIDPSCTLIFEAEEVEADAMKRPPRQPAERLFSMKTIGLAVAQGLSVLAVCVGVFLLLRGGHGVDAARAVTFTTLVVAFLAIILMNRSWSRSMLRSLGVPNGALWWVLGGTAVLLAAVLGFPLGQRLFHFAPLHASDLGISIGAGVACVLWFDLLKIGGRFAPAHPSHPIKENSL
ncbi:MAG: cation-translocating P-type ATPase [Bryobacteraceae bacterium]